MFLLTQFALLIALLIGICIPIWLWESKAKRKKVEETFANRQPLDERAFYERYFESRGVPFFVVSKVRQILEEELEADMSRLSVEDDFTKNLCFFWQYDSLADVRIVVRLEEEFGIKITDAETGTADTVENLIDFVWMKLRQRTA